jgi:uncharacterized protein (DUF1330 family)
MRPYLATCLHLNGLPADRSTILNFSSSTIGALCGLATMTFALSGAWAQTQAPGYVVIEFKIKNAEVFKIYAQQAPETVRKHGGKFAVRPGKAEGLKGDAPQGPFAILAFESAEHARKWANSPEYTALIPLRDKGADTRAFIVEGVAP